jgi:hypothetical protein
LEGCGVDTSRLAEQRQIRRRRHNGDGSASAHCPLMGFALLAPAVWGQLAADPRNKLYLWPPTYARSNFS